MHLSHWRPWPCLSQPGRPFGALAFFDISQGDARSPIYLEGAKLGSEVPAPEARPGQVMEGVDSDPGKDGGPRRPSAMHIMWYGGRKTRIEQVVILSYCDGPFW